MRVWYTLGHLTSLNEVKENKFPEMDSFDAIRFDEERNEIVLSKGNVSSVLIPCDVKSYTMLLDKVLGKDVHEMKISNVLGYLLYEDDENISLLREEIRKYNTILKHMEIEIYA